MNSNVKYVFILFMCSLVHKQFSVSAELDYYSPFNGPSIPEYLKEIPKFFTHPFKPNYNTFVPLPEYDYVIVGSGPAGCVLANRLTEDSNVTVLLLEIGSPEIPSFTDPPAGSVFLQATDYNFAYVTERQQRACQGCIDQRCPWPHGRGLGGSSLINYMIYTRGNRRDFDSWRDAGNPGWGYKDVLPYFMKSENANIKQFNDNGYHGHGGPLSVEDCPFRSKISHATVRSAQEAGYKYLDYNAAEQLGVSYVQATTKNGRRVTSAKAYLEPVKNRRNLHILTNSWVTKVIIESETAQGVLYLHKHRYNKVRARREVILSAGAFESAKLLMLSGIGPQEHLEELGIGAIKDLPVGQTLYEHLGTLAPIYIFDKNFDNLINSDIAFNLKTVVQFIKAQGPLTSNGVESLIYTRTNFSAHSDPGYPDIEIMQLFETIAFDTTVAYQNSLRLTDDLYNYVFKKPLQNMRAMHFIPVLLHPRSKGFLKLKSRNPFHRPLFYANHFDDDRDVDTLVAGIREAIRIGSQSAFQQLGAHLYEAKLRECNFTFNTDEYWRCYIKQVAATFHHQVGTCKMGPESDSSTVVDHRLRVHGIQRLRVVDVGVIPFPPSGHTVAFSYMIGEKAADMIKDDWRSS